MVWMPGQGRLGDKANVPVDSHGCPACPHPGVGPAVRGSHDVQVNGRPALRVGDNGVHAACCGSNTWKAKTGSDTVFINNHPAHRIGDATEHCGGAGKLIEGSSNVIVGGSTSSGGGGASASGGSGRGSSGSGTSASGASPDARGGGPDGAGGASGSHRDGDSAVVGDARPAPSVVAETSFVELVTVNQRGEPVGYLRYEVRGADGEIKTGMTDANGKARIDDLTPGSVEVRFPELNGADWRKQ